MLFKYKYHFRREQEILFLLFSYAVFSGACGPCPVEALRRGDVGQRDDVDAFYALLNSYVRYFYEDDESGWGYSPFRQFR